MRKYLSKYFALTRVLLAETGSMYDIRFGQKGGKWTGPVLWAVVALCLTPLLLVFYVMFQSIFVIFAPSGQLPYITSLMLNMASVVVFLFASFSAPALFYFSRDVEYLLPIPLTPVQIIAAKFTVALLFEYLISLFVMGPMYAAYASHLPIAALTVNAVLVFLTLPIAPLAYSTAIVMLLMPLSSFGRNRDLYNMLVSLLAVAFGLGISLFSQRLNTITAEQATQLIENNQFTANALRTLFPANIYAGHAVAGGDFGALVLSLLITAVTLILFFLLARAVYFKGVVGLSESTVSAKKMTRGDIARNAQGLSVFRSCLQKEIRLLFRSPVALMNCVLMVFLLPLMLAVPTFMNMTEEALTYFVIDFQDPTTIAGIFTGASAVGFLLSSMNMVTSTSISREGRNYFVMKYLPVSYKTILRAKAASGLLVGLGGLATLLVVLEVLFKAPPLILIGVFVLALPGCVSMNFLGLLIDLLKPNLTWDNEQRAVKQNINVLFLMLAGFVLTAVVAVAGLFFLETPLVAFIVLVLLTGAMAAAAYHFVLNIGEELLSKL